MQSQLRPTAVDAEFIASAAAPGQFPAEGLPEVAFLGRSNAGKSTLLNCLVGRPGLAFTSAQPGRTQVVNFFRIGGQFHFVDLPGYGYARVPAGIRGGWRELIDHYLMHRKTLRLSCLVLDARRGWMEKDLELKRWLEVHDRRYVVIASKTDKLKTQQERHRGMAAIRAQSPDGEVLPFSAVTGQGVREIWQAISTIRNSQ